MKRTWLPCYVARLSALLLIVALNACSNVESELRRLANDPSTIIAIRDADDVYWAFSVSRIAQIDGNKIIIKAGTLVVKGSGTAAPEHIAMKLIDLRLKANPGGFGPTGISESDESGQLSGQLHMIEQDTEVRVAKIVHSMKP